MISNEEMYEFASQIAGITDEDLKQYKCGGRMKKDCGGAKIKLQDGKKVTQIGKTKITYDAKKGETTETKTWSDKTTSSRTYDDDGEAITYRGRKGETATNYAGSLKKNEKADSIAKGDWSGRKAPILKKKK